MDLCLPFKPNAKSGDIAEIIIYTHDDADALFSYNERLGIEWWLGQKYGIATVVPEPGTLLLLLVGGLGLLGARRRRNAPITSGKSAYNCGEVIREQ